MSYDEKVASLIEVLLERQDVQDFQAAEGALRAEPELFAAQEKMKNLQKEAILYQKIGKMQAFKETSRAAQKIEKALKNDATVEQYFLKLQDVNDLIQYVTGQIEQKVNDGIKS